MDSKKLIPSIIIAVAIIIAGVFIYLGSQGTAPQTAHQEISIEEARNKAMKFINEKVIQGGEATLVGIEEEYGLYKIEINIYGENHSTYMTKDGSVFFPEGMVIDSYIPWWETEDIMF